MADLTKSPLCTDILGSLGSASWVRRMYELARELIAQHGADHVYDYSIGNPSLEPPREVLDAIKREGARVEPGLHKYMTCRGYPEVREQVAEWLSRQQRLTIGMSNIILTAGSACAINVSLRCLLNPGDGVMVLSPWFAEYPFYILHQRGTFQSAPTTSDFGIDIDGLRRSINEQTRVLILNSPNNPTGRVYSEDEINALVDLLNELNASRPQPIVVITDEVYRRVVFDGISVPTIMDKYRHTILCSSFSKDLGLAGERIGYLVVHPEFDDAERFLAGCELSFRTMGFVNANAIMQRVIATCLEALVDVGVYQRNRDQLVGGLKSFGYDVVSPQGTFFAFPKSPMADDVAFCQTLAKQRVIAVPGSGFGRPGYFRLSFAVPEEAVGKSLPSFKQAIDAV